MPSQPAAHDVHRDTNSRSLAARALGRGRAISTPLLERATDLQLGIDTCAPPLPSAAYRAVQRTPYEPLLYDVLSEMQRRLALGSDDVLFDLGCGKGRVLCWFARSRHRACVGIEFDPRLADAARLNAEKLHRRRSPIEVRTEDAAETDFDQATAIVMYNPFGPELMGVVARRLRDSLIRLPRKLVVAYAGPEQLAEFTAIDPIELTDDFETPYYQGAIRTVIFQLG